MDGYPKHPILIVDDELEALDGAQLMLESEGIENVRLLNDPRAVEQMVRDESFSVMLLDLTMPHISGYELLESVSNDYPELPVIILTGANELDTAVKCMRLGAFDYMVKPVEPERFASGVRRAIEYSELQTEYKLFKNKVLSGKLEHPDCFNELVSQSPRMYSLFQYAETIASTDRPVLIMGESGVGKELFARAIHRLSGREGSWVPLNAAGLDDNVFADTLFGHVTGAFTGADSDRAGLIQKSAGGTLFLDEIGDLSYASQVKLLRLLQEGEFYPLGSDMARPSDARIIVATNCNLEELQGEGKFRSDLYYRLRVHMIEIPPLRERMEDLPILLDYFLEKASNALGKKKPTVPAQLLTLLNNYHFPGNVRELEGMVFDAVSHHESRVLSMSRFKTYLEKAGLSAPILRDEIPNAEETAEGLFSTVSELPSLKDVQKLLIEEAMKRADGNQSIACTILGITRSGLSKALKRFREEGES
jgi:DNA-binding NtrC family response regulator